MKKNLIIYLSVASAGILLVSNLCATKIWSFFGIPVDGGIILFPLSYVIGDLVVELFGRKRANSIVWAGFILNIVAAIAFFVVGLLPAFPEWGEQEAFQTILGFAPRIMVGSLAAYVSSSLLNNFVFERIKNSQTPELRAKRFYIRALGSSVFARLLDTVVFETIAFLGVLPFGDFLTQVAFAYTAGMILEIILCPLTAFLARHLRANAK